LLVERVADLLGRDVRALDRYEAARGCALIARDVFEGCERILGLEIDQRARPMRARLGKA